MGGKSIFGGGKNILVAVIDTHGSEVQARTFGTDDDELPARIERVEDNQYVIVGSYGEGASKRSFYYRLAGTAPTEVSYSLGSVANSGTDFALSYSASSYWVAGHIDDHTKAGVSRGSEMFLLKVDRLSGEETTAAGCGDPIWRERSRHRQSGVHAGRRQFGDFRHDRL